ncbi:hypothetical protein LC605_25785 [Nostoc sp. CHAB 5836]|uniref:hypothetical protein n=1 Tax=Nostoc sp. CHAB 5836 TaxID=2780404 RepID=UPI001E59B721|nr:hypothetical protein [Nostoc sp. CHAB 5836]MCC5618435.1 hypothetical protein [Nostoc sp. CHAB 5836]
MTRINSLFVDEELLTELTPTEGAAIIGGASFDVSNGLSIPIGFQIRGIPGGSYTSTSLTPFETKTYNFPGKNQAQVKFDKKLGPLFQPTVQTISPQPALWTFNVSGTNVILSSFATLVAP